MPVLNNRPLLKTANSKKARFQVIYDGSCGVCNASVNFLRRIDFLHQYSYLTLQAYSKTYDSRIPLEYLQDSIHVIDYERNETTTGMKGVSRLLLHSPPAFPLYLTVVLLRYLAIADPLYMWISASRYVLSRNLIQR